MSEHKTVNLGPNDCCIILREDCSVEQLIPQLEDVEKVPDNVLISTAAASYLLNPKLTQEMVDYLLKIVSDLPPEVIGKE